MAASHSRPCSLSSLASVWFGAVHLTVSRVLGEAHGRDRITLSPAILVF